MNIMGEVCWHCRLNVDSGKDIFPHHGMFWRAGLEPRLNNRTSTKEESGNRHVTCIEKQWVDRVHCEPFAYFPARRKGTATTTRAGGRLQG